ncbi:BTB domain-containing protein [Rhizoctonia solani AG-1 IA]|uniref:BTB domain-containing protein n=1 Tax=Thanatephorus cucumeris (strain AG1-IA) TaxID=983506 RepID=L8WRE9_THACA|nr:BTB domain-containing protein [Rhizoctonia solani AG-1 IA]
MSSNPANILIARSSRSSNTLTALVPTETHAAASAIFPRSSSSPPWLLEEAEVEDIDEVDVSDENADTEPIDVDVTFRYVLRPLVAADASYVGTVKIIVETTTFWAHKDILMFASPFFEAVLSGNWAETSASKNRTSCSSIITISQPPSQPSPVHPSQTAPATSTMPHPSDEIDSDCVRVTDVDTELSSADESDGELAENKERERLESLKKLQGLLAGTGRARSKTAPELSRTSKRRSKPIPDAVIQLKEEKFNFESLTEFQSRMNISHKLVVPSLQTACLQFLLTHAAGKPIKAMRIAELFEHEELYRESSRFVLDNPGASGTLCSVRLAAELLGLQADGGVVDPIAGDLVETGISCLVPIRSRPTVHGIPVFTPIGRRQSSPQPYSPRLPNYGQGMGRYAGSNENAIGATRVTTTSGGSRRHFLFCTLRPEKEKKGRSMSRDITSALAGTSSA